MARMLDTRRKLGAHPQHSASKRANDADGFDAYLARAALSHDSAELRAAAMDMLLRRPERAATVTKRAGAGDREYIRRLALAGNEHARRLVDEMELDGLA